MLFGLGVSTEIRLMLWALNELILDDCVDLNQTSLATKEVSVSFK